MSAVDHEQAQTALRVLSTPDASLTMVLGGDHPKEGIETIQVAMKNPVLRPHFAHIEAKRPAERCGKRKASLKAAAEFADDTTVMSPAEIKKTAMLVKAEGADSASGKSLSKALVDSLYHHAISGAVCAGHRDPYASGVDWNVHTGGKDSRVKPKQAPHIVGHREKITQSSCSRVYPDSMQCPDGGLYDGQKNPHGALISSRHSALLAHGREDEK